MTDKRGGAAKRWPRTGRRGLRRLLFALGVLAWGAGGAKHARAASAPEFEFTTTSVTIDNQINLSSVAYFNKNTTPATPSNATLYGANGGGLYFDGVHYDVWNPGTTSWVALATGAVSGSALSGSGTQNYVAKFNNAGGTSVGNSLIFDNGTNVGISSAAPNNLFVVGAGNGILNVNSNGVGIGAPNPINALDVPTKNPANAGDFVFDNDTNYQVNLLVNATAYTGTIMGSNSGAVNIQESVSHAGTGGGAVDLYTAPSGQGLAPTWTNIGELSNGSTAGTTHVWFSPIGTSSDFYINNADNVGIGSSSPEATLQVGNGSATNDLYVDSNLGGGSVIAGHTGGWIEWDAYPGNNQTDFINDDISGSGGWDFINTNNGGTKISTAEVMDSLGNATFSAEIIASSASFTATGNTLFSLISSSGISVGAGGQVNIGAGGSLCLGGVCDSSWPSGLSGSGATNDMAYWNGAGSLTNLPNMGNGGLVIGTGGTPSTGTLTAANGIVVTNASGLITVGMNMSNANLGTLPAAEGGTQTGAPGAGNEVPFYNGATYVWSAGPSLSSASLTYGLIAATGTFTGGGPSAYSVTASSGISVGGQLNVVSGQYLCLGGTCNSAWPSGGSIGGGNTNLEYNNSGVFAGSNNLEWVNGSNALNIAGVVNASSIAVTYGIIAATGTFTGGGPSAYSVTASSGISVGGQLNVANGQYLCLGGTCNSAWPSGGGIGGNNTDVEYDNSGSFAGSNNFEWVNGSKALNISGVVNASSIAVTYGIIASTFTGNGTALTSLTASNITPGAFASGAYNFPSGNALTLNGGLTIPTAQNISITGGGGSGTSGQVLESLAGSGVQWANLSALAGNLWQQQANVIDLNWNLSGSTNVVVQSSMTIQGTAFSVGGSTFEVTSGQVAIGGAPVAGQALSVSGATTLGGATAINGNTTVGTGDNLIVNSAGTAGVGLAVGASSLNANLVMQVGAAPTGSISGAVSVLGMQVSYSGGIIQLSDSAGNSMMKIK